MKRLVCISCGNPIVKSAFADPYICRACEADHGVEERRFSWLDRM
jgi:hypothetical protein